MRNKKKKNKLVMCDSCTNCVYIGEGDFICTLEEPVLVMEDFCPSDDYMYCGGADYENWDDIDIEQDIKPKKGKKNERNK